MAKFRKKPVEIEAWQYKPARNHLPHWLSKALGDGRVWEAGGALDPFMMIRTPEGDMTANPGDWIIKGIQGELYPCKPDIFVATYDAVDS